MSEYRPPMPDWDGVAQMRENLEVAKGMRAMATEESHPEYVLNLDAIIEDLEAHVAVYDLGRWEAEFMRMKRRGV